MFSNDVFIRGLRLFKYFVQIFILFTYCSCDLSKVVFFEIVFFFIVFVHPNLQTKIPPSNSFLQLHDRLECTDLKLYVESTIVYKFLDASNATEWVFLSDSHSCPLLKEASMKIYASDNNTVPYWNLKGGLN